VVSRGLRSWGELWWYFLRHRALKKDIQNKKIKGGQTNVLLKKSNNRIFK